jgi:hypothetical protein
MRLLCLQGMTPVRAVDLLAGVGLPIVEIVGGASWSTLVTAPLNPASPGRFLALVFHNFLQQLS